MSEPNETPEWIKRDIEEYVESYGAVPPPWVIYPKMHPYDIHWRMGAGESFVDVFWHWWSLQHFAEAQRIEYFRRWPPPPRWLEWLIDAIWESAPEVIDDEEVLAPYFERVESLGFGTRAEYDEDLADPKWLPDGI